MSSAELQAFIARLCTDDSFRQLHHLGVNVGASYQLEDRELRAIKQIDERMLAFFAGSLKRKRRDALERLYPALFRLDSSLIDRYYDRFYHVCPASPYRTQHQDAAEFGKFMEESLLCAASAPPFASDLARYERLFLQARQRAKLAPASRALEPSTRLILAPGVELAEFSFDVPAIEEALRSSTPIDVTAASDPVILLFAPGPLMLRLNNPSKLLLETIEESQVVADIIRRIEERFDTGGVKDSIIASCERFQDLGIVQARSENVA